MKRFFTCLALALLAVSGCSASHGISVKLDKDASLTLHPAQTLELSLEANPTTGYSWDMAVLEGADVVSRSGEPAYTPDSGLIGSGGIIVYRFEAVKKGKARLVFEYRRPWEKGVEPVRKYNVDILVR